MSLGPESDRPTLLMKRENTMTRQLSALALLALSLVFGAVHADDSKILEEAAEVSALKADVGPDGTGTITVRRCDQCELETLNITASTRLYMRKKALPLNHLEKHFGDGATVMFRTDRPEVVRIRLWGQPARTARR